MIVNSKRSKEPERRRAPRRRLGLVAKIDCGGGLPFHGCILSDVSSTGAKLVSVTAPNLPDEFDLLLAGESGPRRRSIVVWRTKTSLGVRFLAQPQK